MGNPPLAPDTPLTAAHASSLLRRITFGPNAGHVDAAVGRPAVDVIDDAFSAGIGWALDDDELDDAVDRDDQGIEEVFSTVMGRMVDPEHGLHERLNWFWQLHFPTSVDKVDAPMLWRQHHLMRRHALGNFAELLRALTTDAAMLLHLDGSSSSGDAPNENYSRESLELFTMGSGYTEDDVRAGARILSGWDVDWETQAVSFDAERNYARPVTFLGTRQRWTVDDWVDAVCNRPETHRHVARRLHTYLVGSDLTDERLEHLAGVFRDQNLEIAPLVREILLGSIGLQHTRARQPLEWTLAALHAIAPRNAPADVAVLEPWQLETLGQLPYHPPNVAGWPLDARWCGATQMIPRTGLLLSWTLPDATVNQIAPTAAAVLDHCGVHDPSASTSAALAELEQTHSEYDQRLELLFLSVLTSPEFSLL